MQGNDHNFLSGCIYLSIAKVIVMRGGSLNLGAMAEAVRLFSVTHTKAMAPFLAQNEYKKSTMLIWMLKLSLPKLCLFFEDRSNEQGKEA